MSKSEEDEIYDVIMDLVTEPPYHWHGGAEVAQEDLPLFALLLFSMMRIKEGKAIRLSLGGRDSREPDKAPVEQLEKGGWTVMLKPTPNPSEMALGYSPERQDYACAAFMPGEPKKLLKRETPPTVILVQLPAEMRKVMQEIAPH